MNKVMISLVILVLLFVIIYGGFLLTRKISYEIFYEDLVQQTIKDMVKPEYLREHYKR